MSADPLADAIAQALHDAWCGEGSHPWIECDEIDVIDPSTGEKQWSWMPVSMKHAAPLFARYLADVPAEALGFEQAIGAYERPNNRTSDRTPFYRRRGGDTT